MTTWRNQPTSELVNLLETDLEKGLAGQEAAVRFAQYRSNKTVVSFKNILLDKNKQIAYLSNRLC